MHKSITYLAQVSHGLAFLAGNLSDFKELKQNGDRKGGRFALRQVILPFGYLCICRLSASISAFQSSHYGSKKLYIPYNYSFNLSIKPIKPIMLKENIFINLLTIRMDSVKF